MNNFQKNEQKGRAKFETFLTSIGITEYHFTEDEFNPVDCYFNQKGNRYIAEIKVRNRCYSTLFMEKGKLASMLQLIKEGKASKGFYVNFIGDKVYMFSLDKIRNFIQQKKLNGEQPFISRLLPKTTSGSTEKVWKLVIELPLDLAFCKTLETE